YSGFGGSFLRSPDFAPASIQRRIVWRSASLKRRSFVKRPRAPSACHGGIFLFETASYISLMFAFALSYSSSENGPKPLGRWQVVQFLYKIGATSSAKVGSAALAERTFGCRASTTPSTAAPIPKTSFGRVVIEGRFGMLVRLLSGRRQSMRNWA